MTEPLVSIIIVNWNGGSVFRDCLKSLCKITYSNWELIVVDNGSTDASHQLPENFKTLVSRCRLIRNKTNLGFAQANNQGYKIAKGKYILLLNNDTKVTKEFLSVLVAKMESDKSIGIIQPKIEMMDKPGYLDNAGSFFTKIGFLEHWGFGRKDSSEFNKETAIFSAKGACMLLRRKLIDKIGLFDADFISYFEESDLCWRVWLAGYKVFFYPKAKIYHKVGFTIKRLDVGNINYHYYKNRISSLIKNLNFLNLMIILPIHIFVSIGIALAFLIRGKVDNSIMILKALLWNILHISKVVAKRRKVQKMRKVMDQQLFLDLSRPVNWKMFYKDFKRVEKDLS